MKATPRPDSHSVVSRSYSLTAMIGRSALRARMASQSWSSGTAATMRTGSNPRSSSSTTSASCSRTQSAPAKPQSCWPSASSGGMFWLLSSLTSMPGTLTRGR